MLGVAGVIGPGESTSEENDRLPSLASLPSLSLIFVVCILSVFLTALDLTKFDFGSA